MEKKKKKISPAVRILIMLLVLLVAVCAYAGIRHYNSTHDESDESANQTEIYTVNEDDITQMSYTLDGVVYTYTREDSDSDWTYTDDQSLALDQDTFGNMVSMAASVSTDQIVQENLDNKADYGLDNPEFTLTITLKDGTTKTLYVGSLNSVTSKYYAYVDGDDRIFTLASDFTSSFTTPDELSSSSTSEALDSSASSYASY